jgi:excisionase family DNA binding protein
LLVLNSLFSNELANLAEVGSEGKKKGKNSLVPLWKIEYNSSYREESGRFQVYWRDAMALGAQGQVAVREVMDIRQAADYLGISGDTLYRYASEGFVPAFKLGNRWRFRKSLLDGWMDEKSGVTAQSAVVDPAAKKPVARAR